jgi:hypothetical protein
VATDREIVGVVSDGQRVGAAFYVKHKHLIRELLQDGKYRRVGSMEDYELYLRDEVACRIPNERKS